MTLQYYVRESKFDAKKVIDKDNKKLNELSGRKEAYAARRDTLDNSLGYEHKRKNEFSTSISRTEKTILKLEEDLVLEKEKLDEYKNDISEAEDNIFKSKTERDSCIGEIENVERDIEKRKRQLEEHNKKLQLSIVKGYKKYMAFVKGEINKFAINQNIRFEHDLANKEYCKALEENPDVMEKQKAIVELESLLDISDVSSVRNVLASKLKEINDEIKKQFPGAFIDHIDKHELSEIIVLYYCEDNDKAIVALPFNKNDWDRISDGNRIDPNNMLIYFVFGVCNSLGLTPKNTKYEIIRNNVNLVVDNAGFDKDKAIEIDLYGGVKMSVILNKLPEEVERAFEYEK